MKNTIRRNQHHIISVAAEGYQTPVIVVYTERDDMHKGAAFAAQGLQIAGGVH